MHDINENNILSVDTTIKSGDIINYKLMGSYKSNKLWFFINDELSHGYGLAERLEERDLFNFYSVRTNNFFDICADIILSNLKLV